MSVCMLICLWIANSDTLKRDNSAQNTIAMRVYLLLHSCVRTWAQTTDRLGCREKKTRVQCCLDPNLECVMLSVWHHTQTHPPANKYTVSRQMALWLWISDLTSTQHTPTEHAYNKAPSARTTFKSNGDVQSGNYNHTCMCCLHCIVVHTNGNLLSLRQSRFPRQIPAFVWFNLFNGCCGNSHYTWLREGQQVSALIALKRKDLLCLCVCVHVCYCFENKTNAF